MTLITSINTSVVCRVYQVAHMIGLKANISADTETLMTFPTVLCVYNRCITGSWDGSHPRRPGTNLSLNVSDPIWGGLPEKAKAMMMMISPEKMRIRITMLQRQEQCQCQTWWHSSCAKSTVYSHISTVRKIRVKAVFLLFIFWSRQYTLGLSHLNHVLSTIL